MTLDDWKKVGEEDDKRVFDLAVIMAANAGGTHENPVFDKQEARTFMLACEQRAFHRSLARAQEKREAASP
jgi:hypothetical protein